MDDSQVQTTNRAETPKKKNLIYVILHNYEIKYTMYYAVGNVCTKHRQ